MNIYDYFYSSDIANHCKSIGHKFNSIETACIIDGSGKTIKQKTLAFQELINNYPNMPFHKSVTFKEHTNIHDYLLALIEYQQAVVAQFESTNNTGQAFYTISEYDAKNMGFTANIYSKSLFFETMDELWYFIHPHMLKNNIQRICVLRGKTKKTFHTVIHYNSDREALYIFDDGYTSPKLGLKNLTPPNPGKLNDLFIHIPIPFSEGDIISVDSTPCVLKSIPHSSPQYARLESGSKKMFYPFSDRPDYAVYYYVAEDGTLRDSFPLSHNIQSPFAVGFGMAIERLEYYKKPIRDEEKILIDLSNHIKSGKAYFLT